MKNQVLMGIIFKLTILIIGCAEVYREYEIYKIVSLERDTAITGSFFIGTGSIGERQYYFVYEEKQPNQYALRKIPAFILCGNHRGSAATLIESEETPRVIKYKINRNHYYYKIYVPFGTVIKEFTTGMK